MRPSAPDSSEGTPPLSACHQPGGDTGMWPSVGDGKTVGCICSVGCRQCSVGGALQGQTQCSVGGVSTQGCLEEQPAQMPPCVVPAQIPSCVVPSGKPWVWRWRVPGGCWDPCVRSLNLRPWLRCILTETSLRHLHDLRPGLRLNIQTKPAQGAGNCTWFKN